MADDPLSDGVSGGRFRNWKAEHNVQPIISQPSLRVYGDYETAGRCEGVELRPASTGINPTILRLDLVDAAGPGGVVSVEERYDAEVDQYQSVSVTDGEGTHISIPVEKID